MKSILFCNVMYYFRFGGGLILATLLIVPQDRKVTNLRGIYQLVIKEVLRERVQPGSLLLSHAKVLVFIHQVLDKTIFHLLLVNH